ncbi:MAG: CDP-diacylglycerol--glycerol-3-phosphate 3-phosphatidyltransferase [Alphaproteobacteria bacterium]
MITSLPNLLTLSRIIAIPLLAALFFIPGDGAKWAAMLLFAAAGLTDFLDGYFARSRRQISRLGRFLDPVADKLLVAAVLFLLVAFGRIAGWTVLPALVILCREILVSGLREFLAGLRVRVPVSRLAKWKTAIQMVAIGFLIVGDASPEGIPALAIGAVGLWVAAALTLITGYDYLRAGLKYMTPQGGPSSADASRSNAPRAAGKTHLSG